MNTPTNFQTIKDNTGAPLFVVLPYAEYMRLYCNDKDSIPHEVISAVVDGETPVKAWREYLGFTQTDIAKRMGVSQSAYAQMENGKPRKATVSNIARALNITAEQLCF